MIDNNDKLVSDIGERMQLLEELVRELQLYRENYAENATRNMSEAHLTNLNLQNQIADLRDRVTHYSPKIDVDELSIRLRNIESEIYFLREQLAQLSQTFFAKGTFTPNKMFPRQWFSKRWLNSKFRSWAVRLIKTNRSLFMLATRLRIFLKRGR